ncbi:MAG: FN3 associated domain-containing protein, partial [Verrucomicrobiales bacterium]
AYTIHEDSKFERSDLATVSYDCTPEDLEIVVSVLKNPVTYVEAGGPLEDGDYTPADPLEPVIVLLDTGTDIPLEYQDSDHFQVSWTYDGSNPLTSSNSVTGIEFTGGYKTNNGHGNNLGDIDYSNPAWQQEALESGMSQEEIDYMVLHYDIENHPHDMIGYTIENWDGLTLLPLRVVARSKNANVVTNSMVHSANITVSRMTLPAPVIVFDEDSTRRGDVVEIHKVVDSGEMPVGARIYYTTDGTDPGDDGKGNPLRGILYQGPFDPLLDAGASLEANIVARVYPPENFAGWFNVSPPSDSPYSVPESDSVEDPEVVVDSWW